MAEIASGPEAIAHGAQRLSEGRLVAFPTETVYGLGADALSAEAVGRVFAFKGRPSSNPLIVHVSGVEMARRVVASWDQRAQKLAEAFWPGPLTIVLEKSEDVPSVVCAGGPTVAVRCPEHPCALALIEAFGGPIVGPSANPSGYISPTTPEHVHDAFFGEDLLVIDGGHCRAGIESTVLDLSGGAPTVLRLGVIGAHAIQSVLGQPVTTTGHDDAQQARSPGLIGAHYQPRTSTRLVGASELASAPSKAVLLSWSRTDHPSGGRLIQMPRWMGAYASVMYRALHEADRGEGSEIWVETPETPKDADELAIHAAVLERLSRATHA